MFVYVGESLVRTYYVPQHQTGNLWTVFKITPSGDFVDINKIEGVTTDSANIGTLLSPALADAHRTASHNAGWSQQDMSASRNFNLLGEAAYQQNDYDQAIRSSRRPSTRGRITARHTATWGWFIRKPVARRKRCGP